MTGDVLRRSGVNFFRRKTRRVERHADGDFGLATQQVRRGDGARHAVTLDRRRIGQHRRRAQDAERFQGQQFRIARPDAESI